MAVKRDWGWAYHSCWIACIVVFKVCDDSLHSFNALISIGNAIGDVCMGETACVRIRSSSSRGCAASELCLEGSSSANYRNLFPLSLLVVLCWWVILTSAWWRVNNIYWTHNLLYYHWYSTHRVWLLQFFYSQDQTMLHLLSSLAREAWSNTFLVLGEKRCYVCLASG